jgi:hypothetical protein
LFAFADVGTDMTICKIRRTAITASAVTCVLAGTAGVANAATGTVHTSGAALTVRAAPGSSYTGWTTKANGASVTITCTTPLAPATS